MVTGFREKSRPVVRHRQCRGSPSLQRGRAGCVTVALNPNSVRMGYARMRRIGSSAGWTQAEKIGVSARLRAPGPVRRTVTDVPITSHKLEETGRTVVCGVGGGCHHADIDCRRRHGCRSALCDERREHTVMKNAIIRCFRLPRADFLMPCPCPPAPSSGPWCWNQTALCLAFLKGPCQQEKQGFPALGHLPDIFFKVPVPHVFMFSSKMSKPILTVLKLAG